MYWLVNLCCGDCGCIPNAVACGKSVYADDITNSVSAKTQPSCVYDAPKRYEAVAGTNINKDKSIGLHLGT